MSGEDTGYSVRRNGSCLHTETDCGTTWSPFHACCPKETYCPSGQSNVICCISEADCSNVIGTNCANRSASLYKANSRHSSGLFCCAEDTWAFELENSFVGCTNDLSDLDASMTQLAVYSSASATSTTSSTTSSTSVTPATTRTTTTTMSTTATAATITSSFPHPSSLADTSTVKSTSSTHPGAIAGGVIGGVAGAVILLALFWFWMRRRNKPQPQQRPRFHELPVASTSTHPPWPQQPSVSAIGSRNDPAIAELPEHRMSYR